jgi:hypothetical protein
MRQKRWVWCWGKKIGTDYMTRWGFSTPYGGVYVHKFIGPDKDERLHDHPWQFVSLILKGGYVETTAGVPPRKWEHVYYGAGRVLFRAERWRHKIWVEPGTTCWTIVVTGRRRHAWGFYDDEGRFYKYEGET